MLLRKLLKGAAKRIKLLVVSRATILNVRVNTAICHAGRKSPPDSVLLNCRGGRSVTGKESRNCNPMWETLGHKTGKICMKARRQAQKEL